MADEFHRTFAGGTAPYENDDIAGAEYPQPALDRSFPDAAYDNAINELPGLKAPGEDYVKGILLKEIWSKALRQPFIRLGNAALDLGHYPTPFKRTLTAIARKANRPSYQVAGAYRPLALIVLLARLYDMIVSNYLAGHLETTFYLPDQSFGGRVARSTTDALTVLTEDMRKAWANGSCVAVLSCDAEACFPSFRNDRVVHAMKMAAVPEKLRNLIASYLHERVTTDRLNGVVSHQFVLAGGLPQGSSLSGPLSNLYMASLPKKITEEHGIPNVIFADDFNVYATGATVAEARARLETAAPSILEWGVRHGIHFALHKWVYGYFTSNFRCDDPEPLRFGDISLEPKKAMKLLGVWIDRKLKFKTHGQAAVKKGQAAVMMLSALANTQSGLTFGLWHRLYNSCVTPATDYGAFVWHSYNKPSGTTKDLQTKVQNLALRSMLGEIGRAHV